MTTPDEAAPGARVRRGRRAVRVTVLCVIVAMILFLAATGWLSGR